jgi:hypothetical protein
MKALAKTTPEKATLDRWHKLIDESSRVVAIAGKTCDVPRDPKTGDLQFEPGTSERTKNIQSDAMLSQRNCPVYLLEHYRRVELAQRIAGGAGAGDHAPAVQFIVQLFKPREYPVIDVTPSDGKE